jgi:hypothetical protein
MHRSGNRASPIILCGTEEENLSPLFLCQCEALASLRHAYLGSFFLDPEDIMNLEVEESCNSSRKLSHTLGVLL